MDILAQPTPRRVVIGQGGPDEQVFKVVVVGDGRVGKSTLIQALGLWWPPMPFESTHSGRVRVDGEVVQVAVVDTAGQDLFDRLRPLSYPGTDAFVICYSVDDCQSLAHVETKWLSEISLHCPNAKHVLVACKVDLRDDRAIGPSCATTEQGAELARRTGAHAFVECSALTGVGVDDVCDEGVRASRATQRATLVRGACLLI